MHHCTIRVHYAIILISRETWTIMVWRIVCIIYRETKTSGAWPIVSFFLSGTSMIYQFFSRICHICSGIKMKITKMDDTGSLWDGHIYVSVWLKLCPGTEKLFRTGMIYNGRDYVLSPGVTLINSQADIDPLQNDCAIHDYNKWCAIENVCCLHCGVRG